MHPDIEKVVYVPFHDPSYISPDGECTLHRLDLNVPYPTYVSDKESALDMVKRNNIKYMHVHPSLQLDVDILEAAFTGYCPHEIFHYLPKNISDKEAIYTIMNTLPDSSVLQFVSKKNGFQDDDEFIKHGIQCGIKEILQFATDRFKDDRDIVLLAAENGIETIQHCNPSFKDDDEIVRATISKLGCPPFLFLSDRFKQDRELVMLGLSVDASCFFAVDERFKFDFETAYLAITNGPGSDPNHKHIHQALWTTKEFLRYCLNKTPAYQVDLQDLRNDRNPVKSIIPSLGFRGFKTIRSDRELFLAFMQKGGERFADCRNIPYQFSFVNVQDADRFAHTLCNWKARGEYRPTEEDCVLNRVWLPQILALGVLPIDPRFIDASLWEQDDVALGIVTNRGQLVEFCPLHLKLSKRVIMEALKTLKPETTRLVIPHMKTELFQDRDVVKLFLETYGDWHPWIPTKFYNDRQLVLDLVSKHGNMIQKANSKFREDRELMLAAISSFPAAIELACYKLSWDMSFTIDAIKRNSLAYNHARDAHKCSRFVMTLVGIGLASLTERLESGQHSFSIEELEQLQDAACFHLLKKRDPITQRMVEERCKSGNFKMDVSEYWSKAQEYFERITAKVYHPSTYMKTSKKRAREILNSGLKGLVKRRRDRGW